MKKKIGNSSLLVYIYTNLINGQGTVKFFNETKGFGFIKEIDSDAEHFVHVSGLIDRISEGTK